MKKTLRSILPLVLLPVMIGAFYLESKLHLPTGVQELVQILIVFITCWLAWRWVIFDEPSNWRESRSLEPVRYHYRFASFVQDAAPFQSEPIDDRLNGSAKAASPKLSPLPKKMSVNKRMLIPISISPARVAHALMSVGVVFALTVMLVLIGSKTLGEGVIAILYLLPIGWCTIRWGKIAGSSAALTAALSFDFLFIPPYGTLTIGSLEGWLLLILFFATAILVVGRIQTLLTEVRERERKATFLYEMVAALANQVTREGIARAIANQIQQTYQAQGVHVHLDGGYGDPSLTAQAGIEQASAPNREPDRALAIVSGPVQVGEIVIWQGRIPLPSKEDPMLQTMLNQTAAALARVRVAEGKPPYPKQKPSFSEGNSLQTFQP